MTPPSFRQLNIRLSNTNVLMCGSGFLMKFRFHSGLQMSEGFVDFPRISLAGQRPGYYKLLGREEK